MKQSVVHIGINVAKAHLDVAWAGTFRRLPNERSGDAALVRWSKQSATPVQLISEASGGYEQALLESLEKSEVKVTLVQAVPLRSPAWRHLITTVGQSAANAPSLVAAPLCVAASTWPHSRPLASTRSCRTFTNVCAPKANRTNWPSPP
jgi:hypothetical protein